MQIKNTILNTERRAEEASIRVILLALISFFLGVAITAFWFHNQSSNNPPMAASTQPSAVSSTNQMAEISASPALPTVNPAPPAPSTPPPVVSQPQIDPATIAEVKEAITNFDTVSEQDGENILRAKALQDFSAAAAQMDAEIKAAQQQLLDAQNGKSAVDPQAAMKHVQDTQLAASEKLKDITAHLQAEIAALRSLKK